MCFYHVHQRTIVTIFFFTPSKIVFLTPGKKEKNGFSPKSKWSAIFRSVISTMGFWLHRGIFWALAVFILGGFSLHGYKNSLVLSKLFKESGIFIVIQNLGNIGVKIQATYWWHCKGYFIDSPSLKISPSYYIGRNEARLLCVTMAIYNFEFECSSLV